MQTRITSREFPDSHIVGVKFTPGTSRVPLAAKHISRDVVKNVFGVKVSIRSERRDDKRSTTMDGDKKSGIEFEPDAPASRTGIASFCFGNERRNAPGSDCDNCPLSSKPSGPSFLISPRGNVSARTAKKWRCEHPSDVAQSRHFGIRFKWNSERIFARPQMEEPASNCFGTAWTVLKRSDVLQGKWLIKVTK